MTPREAQALHAELQRQLAANQQFNDATAGRQHEISSAAGGPMALFGDLLQRKRQFSQTASNLSNLINGIFTGNLGQRQISGVPMKGYGRIIDGIGQ